MKEKKIQKLAGYVDIASRVYPELEPIGDELKRLHAENEELKKQAKLMECRLFILEELKNVAKRIDSENEELRRDAECFRFWVREAEVSPSAMAKLIMNCRTEEDYRNVIEPLAMAAQNAIDAAMKDK